MAPIVSFPLILHVAESVNFPTFELQGVMPIERLVDLRMKKFSRNAAEALWEERFGEDGSPYLGREFSVVWATKARGREQGCSRYYWALMWKGMGLARAVLIMIKMVR